MSTLVTRAGKGSPLTHNEVDANFTNLNTDKIQSGNTVAALTITALTTPSVQASGSGGLALKNSAGTTQISMGAGGGDNVTVAAPIAITPANGLVNIAPTGTGSLTINPATAGTMNNMDIGGTTAAAGSFTDLSVTGTTSFDGAQGTAGQVLTSAGAGATPTWATVSALPSQTGNSGKYLTTDGSAASWGAVTASTATNLAGGALGSVPYQLLSGTTTFLSGNTTTNPQFITSTGVAGLATAPTLTGSTGSGNVVLSTSPTLVTPALGTPSSGTLTNCTFPTLNQNTSGTAAGLSATLAVSSGGTGATTLTANNVLLGNGTSALQVVAPGTNGNVLTSNGTTWTSAAGGLSGSTSQLAKAWVHFNGSNPATIQASYNVSSVTYTSTGRYVVNFTNALADAKYAFAGASSPSNDTTQFIQTGYQPTYGTNTASACYLAVGPSGAVASSTFVTVVFFR